MIKGTHIIKRSKNVLKRIPPIKGAVQSEYQNKEDYLEIFNSEWLEAHKLPARFFINIFIVICSFFNKGDTFPSTVYGFLSPYKASFFCLTQL